MRYSCRGSTVTRFSCSRRRSENRIGVRLTPYRSAMSALAARVPAELTSQAPAKFIAQQHFCGDAGFLGRE